MLRGRYGLPAVAVIAGIAVFTAVWMYAKAVALEEEALQLRRDLERIAVLMRADRAESLQAIEEPVREIPVDEKAEPLPIPLTETDEESPPFPLESFQRPPQPPSDAEVREIDPRHLPPSDPEERARMSRRIRSDAALDREWVRLESRMNRIADDIEREYVQQVMDSLVQVSEYIDRLEEAETAAERQQVQGEMVRALSRLIHHSRTDRNHRIAEYARSIGIDDVDAITDLVVHMERIFRETDTDWSRLFPQGRTEP